MDDDLYPNDGTFIGGVQPEPADQRIARKKEKAQTLQALPILEELVQHLKEKVAFYGSIDAMPDDVKTDPKQFLIVHNANELTRDNLRAELEYIEGLVQEALPNRR